MLCQAHLAATATVQGARAAEAPARAAVAGPADVLEVGCAARASVVTGSDDAGIEGDAGAEGDAPLGAGDDEGATDGAGDAGLLGAGEIIGVGDR